MQPISRGVSLFFGDRSLPAFPSQHEHLSPYELLHKHQYSQAVQMTEKLLAEADIKTQLELITVRVFALLKLREVHQAIQIISVFFPGLDSSPSSSGIYRGHKIPMVLQALSCVVHHLNGDTLRAVNGLYHILARLNQASTSDLEHSERTLVIWILARLQSELGDWDEVERLLNSGPDVPEPLRQALINEEQVISTNRVNAAVSAFYRCEHARAVSILEQSLKEELHLTSAGVGNLNLLYGFFKEEVAERKKSVLNEVCRLYQINQPGSM